MQAEAYSTTAGARDGQHRMSDRWPTLSKERSFQDQVHNL